MLSTLIYSTSSLGMAVEVYWQKVSLFNDLIRIQNDRNIEREGSNGWSLLITCWGGALKYRKNITGGGSWIWQRKVAWKTSLKWLLRYMWKSMNMCIKNIVEKTYSDWLIWYTPSWTSLNAPFGKTFIDETGK